MMNRLTYQDINISNEAARKRLIDYYNNGNYAAAIAELQNAVLSGKHLTASLFNAMTAGIVELQNVPPSPKTDIIKTTSQPPSGIKRGDVWFEKYAPYTWGELDIKQYTFDYVDSLGYTWEEINKGGW